jgi:hypothetical protein
MVQQRLCVVDVEECIIDHPLAVILFRILFLIWPHVYAYCMCCILPTCSRMSVYFSVYDTVFPCV